MLFKAKAIVAIENGFDLDALRRALESIANDLMVDISTTA
jgi:glycine cleavage system regulatory protein